MPDESTPSEQPRSPLDRAFLSDRPQGTTELVLVRHGQQDFPDPTTASIGDWVDPPLSDTGERQALCVGNHLSVETVDAVYSSQLTRANTTGKAIAGHHDLEVTVDDMLAEIGIFRDMPQDQSPTELYGERFMAGMRERFVRHRRWDIYPAGESGDELRTRVVAAIDGIVVAHPGERVVIACHSGVINAWVAELLDSPTDMLYRPAHASVHRFLALDEKRVVHSLNEMHHLASAQLLTF